MIFINLVIEPKAHIMDAKIYDTIYNCKAWI